MMDVVVVTLLRKTLPDCLKAIHEVVPNPNVILITRKAPIGELRNEGVARVKTPLFLFVDDDVIINKKWFEESMRHIGEHDAVGASYSIVFGGFGACLCKTESFKRIKFDRFNDVTIMEKINFKLLKTRVLHKDYHKLQHNIYWVIHGIGYGARPAFKYFIHSKDIYQAVFWGFTVCHSLIRNPIKRWLQ